MDRFGVLSPAIIVYEGMTALAGTGSKRYASFQNQVDGFHSAWKGYFYPRITNGVAIDAEDFKHMPAFQWQEPTQGGNVAATLGRVALLSLPMIFMAIVAGVQLRRTRVG